MCVGVDTDFIEFGNSGFRAVEACFLRVSSKGVGKIIKLVMCLPHKREDLSCSPS